MNRILSRSTGDAFVELDQFVIHAAVQWEFYWTLNKRESYERYRDPVFNRWLWWYSATNEASLTTAITWISKFFEKNSSSINIHYLLQQLAAEPQDWSVEIAAINMILQKAEATATDITIIRSNYYVHKSRKLSFEETMALTSSKYDQVRELIEHMRQCLVVISHAIGGQETITDAPSEKTVAELEEVLKRMKAE
jgi:hypothetical protein